VFFGMPTSGLRRPAWPCSEQRAQPNHTRGSGGLPPAGVWGLGPQDNPEQERRGVLREHTSPTCAMGSGGSAPRVIRNSQKASALHEHSPPRMWRWRESNPRPLASQQGFSGRSPYRLYSTPPLSRTSRCDRPSRCLVSRRPPRPSPAVILLVDARVRSGGATGLTESLSLRQRERTRADSCRHLFVCDGWLTRSSSPSSARFPCIGVQSRDHSPPGSGTSIQYTGSPTPGHLRYAGAAGRC